MKELRKGDKREMKTACAPSRCTYDTQENELQHTCFMKFYFCTFTHKHVDTHTAILRIRVKTNGNDQAEII